MPWSCKSCGTAVPQDDQKVCPTCDGGKAAWTMVQDKTRTFQVSGRRMLLLRGEGWEPVAAETPAAAFVAQRVYVMSREAAHEVAAQGLVPGGARLLFVRLHPHKSKDLTITITADYEAEEAEDHSFQPHDPALDDRGSVDVPFLFVYGPPREGELTFPGIHVMDLGEDTPTGFAPAIEVQALRKKPRKLPTTNVSARWDRRYARVDQLVELLVDGPFADGAQVELEVLEFDQDGEHDFVTALTAEVSGGQARAPWTFQYMPDTDDEASEVEEREGYTAPEFVFLARINELEAESDLLEYQHWIEFELRDEEGQPAAGVKVFLVRPDGRKDPGESDASGLVTWDGIPPGEAYQVELAEMPDETEGNVDDDDDDDDDVVWEEVVVDELDFPDDPDLDSVIYPARLSKPPRNGLAGLLG